MCAPERPLPSLTSQLASPSSRLCLWSGVKVILTAYHPPTPPTPRASPCWCQPGEAVLTSRSSVAPSPTLHRQCLCWRRHMFCHRLSCTRGKGEPGPAAFSRFWPRAPPPRQGGARALTHFLLLPFILTVKVFNPEWGRTFHPFRAPTFFLFFFLPSRLFLKT